MGSTEIEVKQMVNIWSLVGGGMKGARFMAWGPLDWLENHHQVVVVVVSADAAEGTLPCKCLWGLTKCSEKMAKI